MASRTKFYPIPEIKVKPPSRESIVADELIRLDRLVLEAKQRNDFPEARKLQRIRDDHAQRVLVSPKKPKPVQLVIPGFR